MANQDWIFELGVNTQSADQAISSFVAKTTKTLNTIPSYRLTVDSLNATSAVNAFVRNTKSVTAAPIVTTLTANNTQALASIGQVKTALTGLKGSASGAFTGLMSGATSSAGSMRGLTTEIGSQTKAIDFMGKAWSYSLLKFAEYEIIAKSIEGTIHELTDSLKQASDVQFEMSLQKLYSPEVFNSLEKQNQALQSATIIARQWGSDIRDVLQVQGLWTKNTNDLAAAQYLAAKSEEMHRASGIETLEVYRTSIAMLAQMGQTGDRLPGLFDQISEAATRMAVPLNNLSGKGKMESIKEVFEGLAGSAATFKSMGFINDKTGDASVAIATIATLVQTLGKDAKTVSGSLDSMFAAMEGKGKGREAFFNIIGKDTKTPEEMLDRMIAKKDQLLKAASEGTIGVKPQQFEIMTAYLGVLQKIKSEAALIRGNSKGMLDTIAGTQMQLLQGQTDRLRASIQQFTLSLGQQLVPTALNTVQALDKLFPILSANAGAIVGLGKAGAELGLVMLAWQAAIKGGQFFNDFKTSTMAASVEVGRLASVQQAGAIIAAKYGDAELATTEGMAAATAQAQREQVALQELASAAQTAEWRQTGLMNATAKLGVTLTDVAVVAETKVVNAFGAMSGAALAGVGRLTSAMAPLLAIQMAMGWIESHSSTGQMTAVALNNARQNALDVVQNPFKATMATAGQIISTGGTSIEAEHKGASYQALNQALYEAKRDPKYRQSILNEEADIRKQQSPVNPYASGTAISHRGADVGIALVNKSPADMAREQAQRELKINQDYDRIGQMLQTKASDSNVPGYGKVVDWTAELKKSLQATNVGAGAAEMLHSGLPAKDSTSSSALDQTRHQIETDKRDSRADMTVGTDLASAGKMDEERLKRIGETTGWTTDMVKGLTAAYHDQEAAIRLKVAAADSEIGLLTKDKTRAQHDFNTTKAGTKDHEKAKTNLSMVTDAWKVTTAAAREYRAELAEIQAQQAKDEQTFQVRADIRAQGKNGLPQTIEEFRSSGEHALRNAEQAKKFNGASGAITSSQNSEVDITSQLTFLHEELKAHPGDDELRKVVESLSSSLVQLKANVVSDTNEIVKLGQSAQGIGMSSQQKNATDAADIMGLDKKKVSAITDMLAQYKSVSDEQQRLLDLKVQIGNADTAEADTARAQVDWAQQQLDIQTQMIPLVEQEKVLQDQIATIRKSAAYTALDTSLVKDGESFLDQKIKSTFDMSSKPTFGINAKKGEFGRPTKSGGLLSGFLQDYMQTEGTDSIKGVAGNLTDSLLGVKKKKSQSEELKDVYEKAVSGMLNAATVFSTAVDKFGDDMSGKGSGGKLSDLGSIAGGHSTGIEGSGLSSTASILRAGLSFGLSGTSGAPASNGQKNTEANALTGFLSDIAGTGKQTLDATKASVSNTDSLGNTTGIGALIGKLFSPTSSTKGSAGPGQDQANGGMTFFGAHPGQGFSDNGGGSLNAAMGGMSEGAMASSLFGRSGPMGEILGGVGGAAFGPVGGAVGALLGGLIGPHETAAQTPDVSNPTYGQWLSNMTGTENLVNGANIDPQQQYNTYLGYQSESTQLANMVNNPTQDARMTPQLQQMATDLKNLENPQGGGLNITSEHQGELTLGSGKQIDVNDYQNWTDQLQAYQNNNLPLAPLISMNAYGAAGASSNMYNMPGINSSEAAAMQATQFGSMLNPNQAPVAYGNTQVQNTPYSTPGVGTSAPGASPAQPLYVTSSGLQSSQPVQVTLTLNGQVLATAVTAVQTATSASQGKIAA